MEDDISMATQACHLSTRASFKDVGASTQDDFDSATSVVADVVKMTDPKLNLVLAEGGGEPGKNRFGDKQTKDNPFHLQQDIEFINPRVKTRFKEGLIKKQKQN